MLSQTLYDKWSPRVLSLLRIIVGFLYMEHGTSKLFHYPASFGHIPLFSLFWFAGVLETFGGALVLLGLFTRPAAFLLSGEMAIAYFKVFAGKGFWPLVNHGEPAVFYCFVFLYFAVAGAGPWALDRFLHRRSG